MAEICLNISNAKRALFFAIGGGGDIVLTTMLALSYERCGGIAFIGGVVWERYVVDPFPGPIRLSEFKNVDREGFGYIIVDSKSYAVRNGNIIVPQIAKIAKIINRPMYVFDIYEGPRKLANVLIDFIKSKDLDIIIGVDVGGDSIATGFEESLWSPLADSINVAALAHIDNAYLALASPGADGELSTDYVLIRISRIAKLNGLIGGYVIGQKDVEVLKMLSKEAVSEASIAALKAFEGEHGKIYIRSGSRKVILTPLSLTIFILKASIAARDSVAKFIYDADSLEEARAILNSLNIYTELDLEEDIYKEISMGKKIDEINLCDIKEKGKRKLMWKHIMRIPRKNENEYTS